MNTETDTTIADSTLVARFKDGDDSAFAHIVNRYWDKIYARSFQLLKNREDAEEVAQDTFVRAQKGLAKFRGDASFSTWLYQIATNLSHNRYWYWWRRKRSASLSLDQSFGENDDVKLENLIPAEGENPGKAAITQEFVERVSSCMHELSPRHKEILTLRNIHNLSYEEIAEELSISVGTVKSRIARARESLRDKLGSDFR